MFANASLSFTRRDPLSYLLLVAVGCLVALMLPLARLAMEHGLNALAYAFWQALGGGVLLWLWSGRGGSSVPFRQTRRYYLVSGVTAIALPNALAFLVVEQVGAGLTATLYALPSLATYALSVVVRLERLKLLRALGLMLGVLGCVRILSPDTEGVGPEMLPWLMLGLLVPVSLAIGNVYRTVAWPDGATGRQLAPGMLLAGAMVLLPVLIVQGQLADLLVPNWTVFLVLCFQAGVSALTYRLFFELQRRTSPVFLSQIGFVVAPVGLVLGYLMFGERFGLDVWLGVGVLMVGVLLANRHN
ncbi:MAG: EamA family transporter [Marinobacter sp.]|nr:EamA family transporter [Marinobacter sp.]